MSRKWLDVVVLAAIGLQVFTLLAICYSGTAVAYPNDMCCIPAHVATPTAPDGGNQSCSYVRSKMRCMNGAKIENGATCTGSAFQAEVNGQCSNKPSYSCTSTGVSMPVTSTSGTYGCVTIGGSGFQDPTCQCQWTQDSPDKAMTKTDTIPSCIGDGC